MKRISADHDRRIEIPGVPEPVQRPVDIDQLKTCFAKLRTLRIYRFDADSVIHGHAEEDEVLIVVMAGTVELTLTEGNPEDTPRPFTLSAAGEAPGHLCAAYLPPQAAYRLRPQTSADVAYARATPAAGPSPHVFSSRAGTDHPGVALLWEEATYPRLLRVRLMQIRAGQDEIALTPMEQIEDTWEALIHVRTVPEERVATITSAGAEPVPLSSWDTVSVAPGDRPTLRVAMGASALVLIVLADHSLSEIPPQLKGGSYVAGS